MRPRSPICIFIFNCTTRLFWTCSFDVSQLHNVMVPRTDQLTCSKSHVTPLFLSRSMFQTIGNFTHTCSPRPGRPSSTQQMSCRHLASLVSKLLFNPSTPSCPASVPATCSRPPTAGIFDSWSVYKARMWSRLVASRPRYEIYLPELSCWSV